MEFSWLFMHFAYQDRLIGSRIFFLSRKVKSLFLCPNYLNLKGIKENVKERKKFSWHRKLKVSGFFFVNSFFIFKKLKSVLSIIRTWTNERGKLIKFILIYLQISIVTQFTFWAPKFLQRIRRRLCPYLCAPRRNRWQGVVRNWVDGWHPSGD